jgi:hypothetical protein
MPKGHEDFFQSSVMRPWGGMLNSPEEEVESAVAVWKATQRFERAPKQRSTFFQLCDLEDDDMQRHLEAQPVLDTCDVSRQLLARRNEEENLWAAPLFCVGL